MRILMDTHIAMWAITDNPKLSDEAKDILTDVNNEVFYSTASIWETAIKHIIHPDKIDVDGDELMDFCERTGFKVLPILNQHAITVKTLHLRDGALKHNDPFDRMLIAQAKTEGLKFMTHDSLIPFYDEDCISIIS